MHDSSLEVRLKELENVFSLFLSQFFYIILQKQFELLAFCFIWGNGQFHSCIKCLDDLSFVLYFLLVLILLFVSSKIKLNTENVEAFNDIILIRFTNLTILIKVFIRNTSSNLLSIC